MIERASSVFVRFAPALIVLAASSLPAAAQSNVSRLDDRSFKELAKAVESLGAGMGVTAASAAPAARARQTPKTDFGSMVGKGASKSACCAEQLQEIRKTLQSVRADQKRFVVAARQGGNGQTMKQVERLDGRIRSFEKALRDVDRAKDGAAGNRRYTTLSNIMKSMHDTAKSIIQNIKA